MGRVESKRVDISSAIEDILALIFQRLWQIEKRKRKKLRLWNLCAENIHRGIF